MDHHVRRRKSRISSVVHRVNNAVSIRCLRGSWRNAANCFLQSWRRWSTSRFRKGSSPADLDRRSSVRFWKSRTLIHSNSNPGVRFRTSVLFRNCSSASPSPDWAPTSPAINCCLRASQPIGKDTQQKQQSRLWWTISSERWTEASFVHLSCST